MCSYLTKNNQNFTKTVCFSHSESNQAIIRYKGVGFSFFFLFIYLLLTLEPFLFCFIPHYTALKLVLILVHTVYFTATSWEQSMIFFNNVPLY